MTPFTVGTDHELFNNLKIPGTGPGSWPDDFYHSSADTLDKVDPADLRRATGMLAVVGYVLADMPERLVP
jgi:hypothetical protein